MFPANPTYSNTYPYGYVPPTYPPGYVSPVYPLGTYPSGITPIYPSGVVPPVMPAASGQPFGYYPSGPKYI